METADLRAARRFNTLDGMTLVAALGLWLSIMPGYFVSVPGAFREIWDQALQLAGLAPWTTPGPRWVAWQFLHVSVHNLLAPLPFLFGYLVPTVLIMGLRQPRPSWRALVREAGFGSCLLVFLYAFVRLELWWLGGEKLPFAADAVFAGALVWVVLGRRPWHVEPMWFDRLGRVVATYWIIAFSLRAADHILLGCGV
jgi:hypothetical protein